MESERYIADLTQKVRYERFIELLGNKTGKILDLGCWRGNLAFFFGDKDNYYGIEISTQEVKVAKQRGLNVVRCDLNTGIPFQKEFFDIVVASEVIEHLPNIFYVLKEVHRVLKRDGVFIGSTPNATNMSYILSQIFRPLFQWKRELPGPYHVHVFSRVTLKMLFEASGFKIVKLTGTTLLPISKYTLSLNKWLGKKLSYYSSGLVFKAEKIV